MSFECYYDHNKQQFIHKTELILIAAVAVGLSYGLQFFFPHFFLLYGEQIMRCRMERASQRAHGTQYGFRRMSFDLRGQRFERRLNVFLALFSLQPGSSRLNIMLITP